MIDATEAAFLRSIATSADDTPRLVYADWLDEHGDPARAEFVRVQCELASNGLATTRRDELRQREEDLLDEHRQRWCEAFGVPVADVQFDRGLVTAVRVAEWAGGAMLDDARFATVTELDLSGLGIADDGLAAFAARADLPAQRKLILHDNTITTADATALADAAGLPRLETLHLFRNPVAEHLRLTDFHNAKFTLTTLDVGERADGYSLSPGEAEAARQVFVRERLLPVARKYFDTYERLRSAVLCVAQYWADEADDAVHASLIVSELLEPVLKGVNRYEDSVTPDPNLPTTRIKAKYGDYNSSEIALWEEQIGWDDNNGAIPLWAAFAPEGGYQDSETFDESYAPAVLFHRHGGYEFLPMQRPHLDGVRPEWGAED